MASLFTLRIFARNLTHPTLCRHTYIHNWPLQSFSQDYGLASYTTQVVCVNFIRERRDLQFNVDSERQIYEKSVERKSPKKYFLNLIFFFDD